MKTRIVVHIALNAKGERVGTGILACGRLIPFYGCGDFNVIKNRSSFNWINLGFTPWSLTEFKVFFKNAGAARFQRVTLLGEKE